MRIVTFGKCFHNVWAFPGQNCMLFFVFVKEFQTHHSNNLTHANVWVMIPIEVKTS